MPSRKTKYQIVFTECLNSSRCIQAPTEDRIRSSVRNKSCDGTKDARDLKMAAFEFLPKADCAIGARRIGLGGERRCLEQDVRARLFHRNVESRAGTQRKSITQLGVSNTDHAV